MSGYIKQRMLSSEPDQLFRLDLIVCIQDAYKAKILSRQDIEILDLYLSGYINREISVMLNTTQDEVDRILMRVFLILETLTGYDDNSFIQTLNARQYRKSGISKMEELLRKESSDFSHHEI